jgi:hypothetical protein
MLFDLDEDAREVAIVFIGEKRRDSLIVRAEEFTTHHESDSIEWGQGEPEPVRPSLPRRAVASRAERGRLATTELARQLTSREDRSCVSARRWSFDLRDRGLLRSRSCPQIAK